MPDNDFQMIERRQAVRDHGRELLLRSLGIKLEQVRGELKADRLVDYCYSYEEQLTNEARLEQDYCLDYFRKRIPVIMIRYTLVRIVLRHLYGDNPCDVKDGRIVAKTGKGGDELSTLTVTDDDLQFARLIGDWCLMAQMRMFGNMVLEAKERERSNFTPRKRSTKMREAYAALPRQLTTETLVQHGVAQALPQAGVTLRRWLADGLVEKQDKVYVKKYDVIPV
jgi:hypothetical protein